MIHNPWARGTPPPTWEERRRAMPQRLRDRCLMSESKNKKLTATQVGISRLTGHSKGEFPFLEVVSWVSLIFISFWCSPFSQNAVAGPKLLFIFHEKRKQILVWDKIHRSVDPGTGNLEIPGRTFRNVQGLGVVPSYWHRGHSCLEEVILALKRSYLESY